MASSASTRSSLATTSGLNLQHGGVAIAEGTIGVHDGRNRALRLLDAEAQLEGELARLEGLKADGGFNHHLQDHLRLGLGDLLDLHAAALRGDDADALGLTVEHVAEIELRSNGSATSI